MQPFANLTKFSLQNKYLFLKYPHCVLAVWNLNGCYTMYFITAYRQLSNRLKILDTFISSVCGAEHFHIVFLVFWVCSGAPCALTTKSNTSNHSYFGCCCPATWWKRHNVEHSLEWNIIWDCKRKWMTLMGQGRFFFFFKDFIIFFIKSSSR